MAHNQADNLTGYLFSRRTSSKLFYRVSLYHMWIMNVLWPIEALCIIIICIYQIMQRVKLLIMIHVIALNVCMYAPKQTILGLIDYQMVLIYNPLEKGMA